ncbi:MAG: hypothetical protein IKC36_05765, partial [Clostridia bacterium]|nr:hypothetical protein [Clostridia bacterium]
HLYSHVSGSFKNYHLKKTPNVFFRESSLLDSLFKLIENGTTFFQSVVLGHGLSAFAIPLGLSGIGFIFNEIGKLKFIKRKNLFNVMVFILLFCTCVTYLALFIKQNPETFSFKNKKLGSGSLMTLLAWVAAIFIGIDIAIHILYPIIVAYLFPEDTLELWGVSLLDSLLFAVYFLLFGVFNYYNLSFWYAILVIGIFIFLPFELYLLYRIIDKFSIEYSEHPSRFYSNYSATSSSYSSNYDYPEYYQASTEEDTEELKRKREEEEYEYNKKLEEENLTHYYHYKTDVKTTSVEKDNGYYDVSYEATFYFKTNSGKEQTKHATGNTVMSGDYTYTASEVEYLNSYMLGDFYDRHQDI